MEGHDLELQTLRAFPKCAIFVEKPLSITSPEACWRVAKAFRSVKNLVAVGYVFRYLKGNLHSPPMFN